MLDLSMVSYICMNGRENDLERTAFITKLINKTSEIIKFKEILFLTATEPSEKINCKLIRIKEQTYDDYGLNAFQNFHKWCKSDYIMIFQDDGFAVNPHNWSNLFLNYDYVGAPWKHSSWSSPGKEIGNGGFSLRSRKLYEECSKLRYVRGSHEDGLICVSYRNFLIDKGIKFADLNTGYKFSVEGPFDEDHDLEKTFGFHASRHLEKAKKILEIEQ